MRTLKENTVPGTPYGEHRRIEGDRRKAEAGGSGYQGITGKNEWRGKAGVAAFYF